MPGDMFMRDAVVLCVVTDLVIYFKELSTTEKATEGKQEMVRSGYHAYRGWRDCLPAVDAAFANAVGPH